MIDTGHRTTYRLGHEAERQINEIAEDRMWSKVTVLRQALRRFYEEQSVKANSVSALDDVVEAQVVPDLKGLVMAKTVKTELAPQSAPKTKTKAAPKTKAKTKAGPKSAAKSAPKARATVVGAASKRKG